jgi:EAL domain-containing protein (putative c-di-GMP-specific phosphodiesterase class I)/GGDEF domain-containing protein
MPSLFAPHRAWQPVAAGPTASERFTRALVDLTRTVWHPGSTFETAISAICKAAATAMQVDRVSVWQYDRDAGLLNCLHAYTSASGSHADAKALETLSLDGDDYMAALQGVRTFESKDMDADPTIAGSHGDLRDYLQRHRIRGLLDAPVYIGGELQGVVCHECIDRLRSWTQEEATFAASMGDYVAMAYEIARRRRAERDMEDLRLHDPVTGLPNREYMRELIRQRLAAPHAADDTLAVVHVRIDAPNGLVLPADTQTEDEVMAQVARRLRRCAGKNIELARVRADAFAFLLVRHSADRPAISLAQQALSAVQELLWQGRGIDPTAVAGIAFAEPAQDRDAGVVMSQAEEAANRAGAGNKYRYQVFDPDHQAALTSALDYERTMREAFALGEFELHYQPEFDSVLREWVAAEALLRWRRDGRLIVAGEFIEVAEACGLILPLASWALHRACADAALWPRTASGGEAMVRVNVSGRQFDEGGLVEDVHAALAASGLEPSRLSLEITETTLMRDIDQADSMLRQLKDIGVGVAIDDFGTGYASLTYLNRLPIDVIKVDRSFVQNMPGGVVETAIVKAVAGLAHALGIEVIAEGVERIEQQRALEELGVRRMQGWLYGRAMDHEATCRLLESAGGCNEPQPVET